MQENITNFKTFTAGKYLQAIAENKLEATYLRTYEYFDIGSGGSLVPDAVVNSTFGNSRKGYEDRIKTLRNHNNGAISVDHAGVKSLRYVYLDGKPIEAIVETKEQTNSARGVVINIWKQAYTDFKEVLQVEDHKAFDFWYESLHGIPHFDIQQFISSINKMEEFIGDYFDDTDVELKIWQRTIKKIKNF